MEVEVESDLGLGEVPWPRSVGDSTFQQLPSVNMETVFVGCVTPPRGDPGFMARLL